jgi:hypothetical protein
LLSAHLIVIDEVSMLTRSVALRVSLTLGSITGENHRDWDFGSWQLLLVGDLLQLLPVVKNMAIPVVRRMITRLPGWGSMRKFVLQIPQLCGKKRGPLFFRKFQQAN